MNLTKVFQPGTELELSALGRRFRGVILATTIESWERKYLVRWEASGHEEWVNNLALQGGLVN